MSQAGHLQPDPKGKCSPWKHSSDVRPQNRCFPKYGLLSKIPPPQSQSCTPRGETPRGAEMAKNGAKGRKDGKATHG